MSTETRLAKIEKQLGVGRDDEIIEFPWLDGLSEPRAACLTIF